MTMTLEQQSIKATNFEFENQTNFYKGKVRDVYTIQDKLVMVASDRISAFDHVLPRAIPFKGQVLNQIALHFLNATSDIVTNWVEATPDANVAVGIACDPFKIEMVIRGYCVGHAWRTYRSVLLEKYTRELFQRGTEMAAKQGLILADTKYEFGKKDGKIILIDEIHTPDSSRYFYADGFEARQASGEKQKHLSKEFVREWLIANGFQGLEGQTMPEMPDEFVQSVSDRYIELFENITGSNFEKANTENITERIFKNTAEYLKG